MEAQLLLPHPHQLALRQATSLVRSLRAQARETPYSHEPVVRFATYRAGSGACPAGEQSQTRDGFRTLTIARLRP
jgi:hypothetical protein